MAANASARQRAGLDVEHPRSPLITADMVSLSAGKKRFNSGKLKILPYDE